MLMINFIWFSEGKSWSYPLIVDITEITFDYQSGYTYDALDIRKNNTTDISKPEYKPSSGRNNPFAYIKNQSSRKVKAKFYHNQGDSSDIFTMTIGAIMGSGTGLGDLPPVVVSFPGGAATSSQALFTGQDPISGTIGKRNFLWSWYVSKVNGQSIGMQEHASTSHGYFTLLNTPQNPMPEPWTEVLDYACVWAANKSSESSAVRAITQKAYTSFNRKYNGNKDHTNVSTKTFYLTIFLADPTHDADCSDMAATVNVFTRAIGVSFSKVRKIYPPFVYKRIKPVGEGVWRLAGSGSFNYHYISWFNGKVYDSCLKLCNNQTPPGNERVPQGENINDPYEVDLRYSGTWVVDEPFYFENIE